jgi:hypothetical protein
MTPGSGMANPKRPTFFKGGPTRTEHVKILSGVMPSAIDPEAADRLWVQSEELLGR